MSVESVDDISQESLNKIQESSFYFGHQSVGINILDGISDLSESINIQPLKNYTDSGNPVFLHSQVGENYNPQSKLKDFSNVLSNNIGTSVNTAFLKFCYLDINEKTDVETFFDDYAKAYKKINDQFPNITFVHFTTPLMSQQKGIKAFIKKIIGREVYGFEDNLNRQRFNEKIREKYDIVFDIARIESTKPDGSRLVHNLNNSEYYSMYPAYSDDGGHLNELGRKIVARELILFLSEL